MTITNKDIYKKFFISLLIYAGIFLVGSLFLGGFPGLVLGVIFFVITVVNGVIPAFLTAYFSIKIKDFLIIKQSDCMKPKWMTLTLLVGTGIATVMNFIYGQPWPILLMSVSGFICTFIACLTIYDRLDDPF